MTKKDEDTTNQGFEPENSKTEISDLNEDDLEQVSGGTDPRKGQGSTTYGVQKDKLKSANKNADAVKGLL